jgi:hypothetical protein
MIVINDRCDMWCDVCVWVWVSAEYENTTYKYVLVQIVYPETAYIHYGLWSIARNRYESSKKVTKFRFTQTQIKIKIKREAPIPIVLSLSPLHY